MPEGITEWVLGKLNLLPKPLGDTFAAMMLCRTVMAASRLGVFEALAREPKSVADVAAALDCSPRMVARLLEALECSGYVHRQGEQYRLSRVARRWLVRESPQYLGHFLRFTYDLWEIWGHAEEALRTGEGLDFHQRLFDEDGWHRYLYGMKDIAVLTAPELVRKVPLPKGARRFLDIGGGHGWMSILLCRRYRNLHATVLDLEPAVKVGKRIVAEEGMEGRVSFVAGDLRVSDFGRENDGVLLSSVIHHFDEAENRETVRRAYAALKSGGVLAINDLLRDPRHRAKQVTTLLGLHFMLSSRSDTFSPEVIAGWLKEVGFVQIRRDDLRRAPGFGLILGRKP